MSERETPEVATHVLVPVSTAEKLRELSKKTRITQSEFLREAVEDLLKKYAALDVNNAAIGNAALGMNTAALDVNNAALGEKNQKINTSNTLEESSPTEENI